MVHQLGNRCNDARSHCIKPAQSWLDREPPYLDTMGVYEVSRPQLGAQGAPSWS